MEWHETLPTRPLPTRPLTSGDLAELRGMSEVHEARILDRNREGEASAVLVVVDDWVEAYRYRPTRDPGLSPWETFYTADQPVWCPGLDAFAALHEEPEDGLTEW